MLEAIQLRKEFKGPSGPVVAVADASLKLEEGGFVAIVGKSGSGKSTLLSLLGSLETPTGGQVLADGQDVAHLGAAELTKYRAKHVGFVFQSYQLIPNLSALENVTLAMEFAGLPRAKRAEQARMLLEWVGLDEAKRTRRPGRLSGGEQQRVAIARALANKPKIILADEPTGNLDSATGQVIIDLLKRLAKHYKITVVVVTHDTKLASQADRAYEMQDGKLRPAAAR
jgi:putative ABC transport system ATP-binding protein